MNYIPELATFGIMVSGFMFLVGARRLGKRLLATVLACAFVGLAFEPVLARLGPSVLEAVPPWVGIAGIGIVGLWILQAFLTLLFGRSVASTAVGGIVSQFVITLGRMSVVPFRWLGEVLRFLR